MSFFADPGAWFDQAAQDVGEALQEGPTNIANEIATGDVVTGILKTQDDFAQVIYDVFNPNNPDPNSVVDQIENTIDQQPTPDYVIDQIESTIDQPPTSDYVIDQIESTNDQQPTPDYIVGSDFNNPAPELPSPVAETYDPLINPDPGLESSAFELSAMRAGGGLIDTDWGPVDYITIETLLELVASTGDYSLMRDPKIIQDLLFGLQPEQERFGYVG